MLPTKNSARKLAFSVRCMPLPWAYREGHSEFEERPTRHRFARSSGVTGSFQGRHSGRPPGEAGDHPDRQPHGQVRSPSGSRWGLRLPAPDPGASAHGFPGVTSARLRQLTWPCRWPVVGMSRVLETHQKSSPFFEVRLLLEGGVCGTASIHREAKVVARKRRAGRSEKFLWN